MKSSNEISPLMQSVIDDNFDLFNRLVTTEDVNFTNKFGKSAIWYVIEYDRFEFIAALVAKKANINAKNLEGDTPLIKACKDDKTDCARELLSSHADMYVKSTEGKYAYQYAVEWKNKNLIDEFITSNFDTSKVGAGTFINSHNLSDQYARTAEARKENFSEKYKRIYEVPKKKESVSEYLKSHKTQILLTTGAVIFAIGLVAACVLYPLLPSLLTFGILLLASIAALTPVAIAVVGTVESFVKKPFSFNLISYFPTRL